MRRNTIQAWQSLVIAVVAALISFMTVERFWIQPACEQRYPQLELQYITFSRVFFNDYPAADQYVECTMRDATGEKYEFWLESSNVDVLRALTWVTHPVVLLVMIPSIVDPIIVLWLRSRQKRESEVEIMN